MSNFSRKKKFKASWKRLKYDFWPKNTVQIFPFTFLKRGDALIMDNTLFRRNTVFPNWTTNWCRLEAAIPWKVDWHFVEFVECSLVIIRAWLLAGILVVEGSYLFEHRWCTSRLFLGPFLLGGSRVGCLSCPRASLHLKKWTFALKDRWKYITAGSEFTMPNETYATFFFSKQWSSSELWAPSWWLGS